MKKLQDIVPNKSTIPTVTNSVPNTTVHNTALEARADARKAVMDLYKGDFGYSIILKEGRVSEEQLTNVFDDLKLSRTSPKPYDVTQHSRTTHANETLTNNRLLETTSQRNDIAVSKVLDPSSSLNTIDVTTPHVEKAGNLSPNTSPTTGTKTAATTDKERTLQLKMEALRKSREERAQKAAAKNVQAAPTAPVTAQAEPPKSVAVPEFAPKSVGSAPQTKAESDSHTAVHVVSECSASPLTSGSPSTQAEHIKIQEQTPKTPSVPVQSFQHQPPSSSTAIHSLTQNNAAQQSIIPGLFINQRKRPVAADFDTPATMAPFKRPFGEIRSETPLVIDVSEEEDESDDEDVEMDLESPIEQSSPVQPSRSLSNQHNQYTSSLSNTPQRIPATPQFANAGINTPPATQTIRGGPIDVLRAKEQQIEEMRRKIAEAEAAKAQKRAQKIASGNSTPRQTDINNETGKPTNGTAIRASENSSPVHKIQIAVQIQESINTADGKVNAEQKRLSEAQVVEQEKAAELKIQEAESKRLRRQRLASDLPRVDAEVVEKQRKLDELRAQMAQMEAEIQKTLEDKRKLAEEMEILGQDTEDQLQAQKDRLDELTNINDAHDLISSQPASEVVPVPGISTTIHPETEFVQQRSPLHHTDKLDGARIINYSLSAERQVAVPNTHDNGRSDAFEEPKPQHTAGLEPSRREEIATADQILDDALQEAARAEADSSGHGESDAMDADDFYATEDPPEIDNHSTSMDVDDRSPSYSPVLERSTHNVVEPESDHYSPVPEHIESRDIESDDYEPDDYEPEALSSISNSPPFSPEPPQQPLENGEFMKVAQVRDEGEVTDETEDAGMTNGSGILSNENEKAMAIDGTGVEAFSKDGENLTAIDDSEHDTAGAQVQTVRKFSLSNDDIEAEDTIPQSKGGHPVLNEDSIVANPDETPLFTPYESPLKMLRTYRFHPDYNKEITGGYRSLTYNHNIDPKKTFCPWELGGACNDKTCTYQHFKDIGLLDSVIITSLGNPDEFIGEQRQRFCDGLKHTLSNLREKKVKDFDVIAKEVVAHRTRFLGNESKVLTGTT
ncbi:hypothetical protein B0O99DRAFT_636483 [Bisporella sp. PMI_857]|nr:hypothetical protein B0O99DRAFT_636483 [Bisporella sp. PMI_857]